MPENIFIDTLRIEDGDCGDEYKGPTIFANFNPAFTDENYVQAFPYITTRNVTLRNVITASGKPLRVSDNPVMFRDVAIDQKASR